MKRIIFAAILLVCGSAATSNALHAQTYGGAVLDHDIMMPSDFISLSQTQVFGTARSMAMGGAFTSLGGDVSSISINPAGVGMFSHNVISLTPMVSISNASTAGVPTWVGNNKSKFGFSNMGAVFSLSEYKSGSLIAINAGFAYNRLADYNSQMSFSSESLYSPARDVAVPSIVDVFSNQLGGAGIYPSADNGLMDYDNDPYFWPAQAAYNTLMIDPIGGDAGWTTNAIGYNASVLGSYEMKQAGRADEYAFSLAANIGNYLYLGATVSLQEITQSTKYIYQEEYNYYDDEGGYARPGNSDGTGVDPDPDVILSKQALYSNLWQGTSLSGVGTNIKLGMVIRPMRALRIGVAYHSPTYYTLARTYKTSMEAKFIDNNNDDVWAEGSTSPEFVDNYENSWKFRTPSKLLVGASLQFGSFGVLTADYERQWYNWTRVSYSPGALTPYDYKTNFEANYKASNTLRLGVEVKPIPVVALRAGCGVSSSAIRDNVNLYSSPVPTSNHYITCGLGFQLSRSTSLDLAYQYYHQNYSSYYLFYSEFDDGIAGSNLFNSSMDRHYITASLTFRL